MKAKTKSAPPSVTARPTELVSVAFRPSPEQTHFNQLLEKIDFTSSTIQQLTVLANTFRPERSRKIRPLLKKRCSVNEQLALFLEKCLQEPQGLSKQQQSNVAQLAMAAAQQVVYSGEISEQLKAALDRLANWERPRLSEDDTTEEQHREVQGDKEPSDYESSNSERSNAEPSVEGQRSKKASRKYDRTAKADEKETLDAKAALRLVYRKLASALHPDREPDHAERLRKTILMTRVNTANDNNDLLTLLRLQLEVEQINPETIAALATDQLRPYNKILNEQLRVLNSELLFLEQQMRAEFNLSYGAITSKALQQGMRNQVSSLQLHIEQVTEVLQYIQIDKNLKSWIKNQL